MSPEQGRGLPLDARSDLYALGVLAFEMLTGRVPFHDDNPMTVIQMHLRGEVPPLPQTVPYSVQQVVRRALEKDPARRYQSSGEMMQHCQQVFAELNQGGASIGAGGVPRTMVAQGPPGGFGQPQGGPPPGFGPPGQGGPPPGFVPGGPPPAMPPGGYGQPGMAPAGGNAAAKTMIAGQSPFAGGAMPQGMGGPPPGFAPGGPPPPGFGGPGGPPPGGYGAGGSPGLAGVQAASPMQKTMMAQVGPGAGPMAMKPGMQEHQNANKTVMLQPSEGVVSIARGGQVAPQGASTAFWIVSLLVGVGLGVLGYVIAINA
jgi:serine/threonine-protein kinase